VYNRHERLRGDSVAVFLTGADHAVIKKEVGDRNVMVNYPEGDSKPSYKTAIPRRTAQVSLGSTARKWWIRLT